MENCCSSNVHRHHGPMAAAKIFRIVAMVIGGVVLAAFFALVFGYVVMLLWNWLMPALFGIKTITYLQAFGIVLLAKILFGGFGHHGRSHHDKWAKKHMRGKEDWYSGDWDPGQFSHYWRPYRRYWEEEGKQAYENYLERQGLKEKPGTTDSNV